MVSNGGDAMKRSDMKPVCVHLPVQILERIHEMVNFEYVPNTCEYIRNAVITQMKSDMLWLQELRREKNERG